MFAAVPGYFVETQGGDYPHYVRIAASPLASGVPSPWLYRPLNPLFASLVIKAGVPADVAFFVLTFAWALASCLLMQAYLRLLSLSPFAARTGAVLFAVSVGAYVPLRRYYGYPDALTNGFILLVLVSAASGRRVATTVALGLGSLAKESLLLLLPFLAWRSTAAGVRWPRLVAMLSVPVAVYVLLRLVIPSTDPNGHSVALSLDAQIGYWKTAMVHGWVRWVLWAFAYSMGPVWVIAALGAPRNGRFIGQFALFLLALLAPLARTTDTERALMLAFPVVFPLAAYAIDLCGDRRRACAVAAIAIACTWAAQLTFDWSPSARVGPVNAKDVVFVLLCVTPAAAVMWCSRRSPSPAVSPLTWPDPLPRLTRTGSSAG